MSPAKATATKPRRKRSKITPDAIKLQERRAEALELRKAGMTFRAIGEQQGTSTSSAHEDVTVAMRETIQEPADELRRMELERLDLMFNALHPIATETGHKQQARAVEQCLSIMDRRAKLLGLDAPSRRITEVYTDDVGRKLLDEIRADPDFALGAESEPAAGAS